jgi:hypothetical protein
MGTDCIKSDGYFTWLVHLYDKLPTTLESQLGYAPGVLRLGWRLVSPRVPLSGADIDLRGSTRWCDGFLPDGRQIGSVIAERSDPDRARDQLARFFDRGLDRRPAKVLPNAPRPHGYVSAKGGGIPQFKLLHPVEWVVLADIGPAEVLRRTAVQGAVS